MTRLNPHITGWTTLKKTYTKILVFAVMVTYFLGFIIGGILTIIYPEHLGEWLTYIGGAAVTAIGFYCWKAKAENTIKIEKNLKEHELQIRQKLSDYEYEEVKMSVDEILAEIEEEQIL